MIKILLGIFWYNQINGNSPAFVITLGIVTIISIVLLIGAIISIIYTHKGE